MVDIETTGVTPGCNILSIGACTFMLPENTPRNHFYEVADIASGYALGLADNPDTIDWWNRQDVTIRAETFAGTVPLSDVLFSFDVWLRNVSGGDTENLVMWCKGTDFDFPILTHVYKLLDFKPIWPSNSVRDYRTLKAIFPGILPTKRNFKLHSAIEDAIHQAEHCEFILDWIGQFK